MLDFLLITIKIALLAGLFVLYEENQHSPFVVTLLFLTSVILSANLLRLIFKIFEWIYFESARDKEPFGSKGARVDLERPRPIKISYVQVNPTCRPTTRLTFSHPRSSCWF